MPRQRVTPPPAVCLPLRRHARFAAIRHACSLHAARHAAFSMLPPIVNRVRDADMHDVLRVRPLRQNVFKPNTPGRHASPEYLMFAIFCVSACRKKRWCSEAVQNGTAVAVAIPHKT